MFWRRREQVDKQSTTRPPAKEELPDTRVKHFDIPYAEGTPPGWNEYVSKHFRLKPVGDAQYIVGECPQCEHENYWKKVTPDTQDIPRAQEEERAKAGGAAKGESVTVHVECNCGSVHPNAPEGATGCGIHGGIKVTSKQQLEAAELTPEEREASIWAEGRSKERLAASRSVAEKWGVAWGAITGLFGVAALVQVDEAVDSLARGWKWGYLSAVAVALALSAWSVALAFLAASAKYGRIPKEASKQLALVRSLVDRARHLLIWSMIVAAVALVVLFVSFGIRWMAPTTTTTTSLSTTTTVSMEDRSAE